jgi:hypothetical protein
MVAEDILLNGEKYSVVGVMPQSVIPRNLAA